MFRVLWRARMLVAAAVLLVLGMPGPASAAPREPSAAADCPAANRVDKTLKNGARWQMCWDVDRNTGVVLSDVTYTPLRGTPTRVLKSASLAEVHVPYDSGQPRFYDVSSIGFGDLEQGTLTRLTKKDCPTGRLGSFRDTAVLCSEEQPRPFAYKSAVEKGVLHGSDLTVFSVSEIGWYDYIVEWRFADDGSITPRAGATGSLSPFQFSDATSGWPTGVGSTRFSENHTHNIFWRLDFDVDGERKNAVEQYDFPGGGAAKRTTERTVLSRETAADLAPTRFWRVVNPTAENADGHPKSWEIDNHESDQYRGPDHTEDFTHHDMYFTRYRACERLAYGNAANSYGTTASGCAASVDRFVNGEKLTDPVAWVSVDFHHVPRDEDQDPMPTHWQGFRIVPRDVTATSRLP
ncbi:copper amine oxidase [Streptomyces sp. NA02950]|uniref:copper amine oxidase n=1 Tax=Streptomyces sp. NA02950 TaxID=2742137 RepID=UPI0020CB1C15|nr:copper amine oxidase [Streptomyces sp. NA02950]